MVEDVTLLSISIITNEIRVFLNITFALSVK